MAYRDEFSSGDRPAPDAARQADPVAEKPQPVFPPPLAAATPGSGGASAPSKKPVKRVIGGLVLLAALGFGGHEGYGWWTNGRFMVSTDDAYVRADITNLAAKVSGYVETVGVAENQRVDAGALIARIDPGDYRLALQTARDKLATQEAAVTRIGRQIEAGRANVDQASAQVAAAEAEATRAAADLERQERLAQSDYATRARLETSRADNERAQASVRSAQAALEAARANVSVLEAQRGEAERVSAELRTALQRAERDLSFTEIRAPVEGSVGNKAVEVGSFVQPGTRLAALVPLDTVHVTANFKETQLASVRPGQTARIAVDAFPDHDIRGTVESIAPGSGATFSLLPPENATGNFTKIVQRVPVRIAVPAQVAREGILRPGLSVVVSVDSREQPAQAQAAR